MLPTNSQTLLNKMHSIIPLSILPSRHSQEVPSLLSMVSTVVYYMLASERRKPRDVIYGTWRLQL